MDKNNNKSKTIQTIGPSVYISVDGHENIPAKVDTGAESSSIWASNISVDKDGKLSFCLFGEGSPFYDGKTITCKDYKVTVTRSAMGEEQIRYRVYLPISINERKIRVLFSLADRSKNNFPILIGKRTLNGKYIVDVSKPNIEHEHKPKRYKGLSKLLRKDPRKFHETFIKKGDNK